MLPQGEGTAPAADPEAAQPGSPPAPPAGEDQQSALALVPPVGEEPASPAVGQQPGAGPAPEAVPVDAAAPAAVPASRAAPRAGTRTPRTSPAVPAAPSTRATAEPGGLPAPYTPPAAPAPASAPGIQNQPYGRVPEEIWDRIQRASWTAYYQAGTWATYSPNLPAQVWDAVNAWAGEASVHSRHHDGRKIGTNHVLDTALLWLLPRNPDGSIDTAAAERAGAEWMAAHPGTTGSRRKSTGSRLSGALAQDLYDLGDRTRRSSIPIWAMLAAYIDKFLHQVTGDPEGS